MTSRAQSCGTFEPNAFRPSLCKHCLRPAVQHSDSFTPTSPSTSAPLRSPPGVTSHPSTPSSQSRPSWSSTATPQSNGSSGVDAPGRPRMSPLELQQELDRKRENHQRSASADYRVSTPLSASPQQPPFATNSPTAGSAAPRIQSWPLKTFQHSDDPQPFPLTSPPTGPPPSRYPTQYTRPHSAGSPSDAQQFHSGSARLPQSPYPHVGVAGEVAPVVRRDIPASIPFVSYDESASYDDTPPPPYQVQSPATSPHTFPLSSDHQMPVFHEAAGGYQMQYQYPLHSQVMEAASVDCPLGLHCGHGGCQFRHPARPSWSQPSLSVAGGPPHARQRSSAAEQPLDPSLLAPIDNRPANVKAQTGAPVKKGPCMSGRTCAEADCKKTHPRGRRLGPGGGWQGEAVKGSPVWEKGRDVGEDFDHGVDENDDGHSRADMRDGRKNAGTRHPARHLPSPPPAWDAKAAAKQRQAESIKSGRRGVKGDQDGSHQKPFRVLFMGETGSGQHNSCTEALPPPQSSYLFHCTHLLSPTTIVPSSSPLSCLPCRCLWLLHCGFLSSLPTPSLRQVDYAEYVHQLLPWRGARAPEDSHPLRGPRGAH